MRFHGWVDQRNHDFGLVKSEGIRRVKLALEAAGMDMPEPIYRVQLSRRVGAPTPSATKATKVAAQPDTRALSDIELQIAEDPHRNGDLLDTSAPNE